MPRGLPKIDPDKAKRGKVGGNAGKGRPKGAVNRATKDLKEMIIGALNAVGGQKYLAEQARANPVAFLSLLGKILPMQVNGSANVLLIEQLCVVANQEWQKEREALKTIEASPSDVSDEEEGKPMKPQVH